MADSNCVGNQLPGSFGNYAVGFAQAVKLSSTGNTVANLSVVGTSVIYRRVTIANATGNVALANVAILTSNDGNLSNAIGNATLLTTVSGSTKYVDLGLGSNVGNTVYSNPALFLRVITASGNSNTVNVTVYGDVVTP
jgi:hypothetical protein